MMYTLFGVDWIMPKSVRALFASWGRGCPKDRYQKIWRMVPLYVIWCIWCERSLRAFEGKESSSLIFFIFFIFLISRAPP